MLLSCGRRIRRCHPRAPSVTEVCPKSAPFPAGGAIASHPGPHPGAPCAPGQALAQGSRYDWRRPGHVAAVGGVVYDPQCVPLRSAGVNVPNLPYRAGTAETLSWLRAHNQRWLRVFATGHALSPERAPRGQSASAGALRSLLREVEGFNAGVAPEERIYVLVALTDYYDPGVPGDRFAFDHPRYRGSPVLPAPWYRAGVARYDFVQEHGLGRLNGMPNYEVNFRPWVRALVVQRGPQPGPDGVAAGQRAEGAGEPAQRGQHGAGLRLVPRLHPGHRGHDPGRRPQPPDLHGRAVHGRAGGLGVPPSDAPGCSPSTAGRRPAAPPAEYRAFVQQALDACGRRLLERVGADPLRLRPLRPGRRRRDAGGRGGGRC